MKAKSSLQLQCDDCQIVKRRNKIGRLRKYVTCKKNGRHKRRAG